MYVKCPACKTTVDVNEQFAGQRVRCPHCQQIMTAPMVAATMQESLHDLSLAGGITEKTNRPGARTPAIVSSQHKQSSVQSGSRERSRSTPVVLIVTLVAAAALLLFCIPVGVLSIFLIRLATTSNDSAAAFADQRALVDANQELAPKKRPVRPGKLLPKNKIDKKTLTKLLDVLSKKESALNAADQLIVLRPDENDIVKPAIKLLSSPHFQVRIAAMKVIRYLGPAAKDAVLPLVQELRTPSSRVSISPASRALARIGKPAVPELIELLKEDYPLSALACTTLRRMGPEGKEAVPQLMKMLDEPESKSWQMAAWAISRVAPEKSEAIPKIFDGMSRANSKNFISVALRHFHNAAKHLRPYLTDKDPKIQAAAIFSLPATPDSKSAVPIVSALLMTKERPVFEATAGFLGAMGPDAKSAIPDMVQFLKNFDESLLISGSERGKRGLILKALGKMGRKAKVALPVAVDFLHHPQNIVLQQDAARFIGELGPDGAPAVPALIKILKSRNLRHISLKREAAIAVGRIGPSAKAAIPALIENLTCKYLGPGYASAQALGKFGPAAREAIPHLKDVVRNSKGSQTRIEAALALWRLEKNVKDTVPALREECKHRLMWNRVDAAFALWQITKEKAAIQLLADQFTKATAFSGSHHHALKQLGKIGPPAKFTVPQLLPFVDRFPDFGSTRRLLIDTIQRIDPDALVNAGIV